MPLLILSIVIQVAFVVHIIKTGRNTTWIWIVMMLPAAGAIAYLIIEILPDMMSNKHVKKAGANINKTINPNKDIKEAVRNYSISNTVDASIKLAEECMLRHRYTEAKQLYQQCLKGIHEYDPDIMYKLACAEFALNNTTEVQQLLDKLIKENPQYKNADAHLLYARTLEQLQQTDKALNEYKTLDSYYKGPEARCRYATLLKHQGDTKTASELFAKVVHEASYSGKHYNTLYKQWIKMAKAEAR